ncbi:hypothetical protein SS05631_c40870 [Sinorhizobium sp. CCBAU 05631]|nr:hypothetical protein SS05631_c40870 [Sinorhizobium sp. CCBAU 05631]
MAGEGVEHAGDPWSCDRSIVVLSLFKGKPHQGFDGSSVR